jgi:hypothetical protein
MKRNSHTVPLLVITLLFVGCGAVEIDDESDSARGKADIVGGEELDAWLEARRAEKRAEKPAEGPAGPEVTSRDFYYSYEEPEWDGTVGSVFGIMPPALIDLLFEVKLHPSSAYRVRLEARPRWTNSEPGDSSVEVLYRAQSDHPRPSDRWRCERRYPYPDANDFICPKGKFGIYEQDGGDEDSFSLRQEWHSETLQDGDALDFGVLESSNLRILVRAQDAEDLAVGLEIREEL